jgi:hypothetical protein
MLWIVKMAGLVTAAPEMAAVPGTVNNPKTVQGTVTLLRTLQKILAQVRSF